MKYAEWIGERTRLLAELNDLYQRAATVEEFEAFTKREKSWRQLSRRYYKASDRGFVMIYGDYWSRPPRVTLSIRDTSRFQERTFIIFDGFTSLYDHPPLTEEEIRASNVAERALRDWMSGTIDELPPGISRDDAYAPWRRS